MKNLYYGSQYIDKKDIQAVTNALSNRLITQGKIVENFEKKLQNFFGAKYCLAVSSGTAALHLSMIAIGLKKNDIIITTPITFAASAVAALHLNCKIILVDIDKISKTIDVEKLEKKLNQLKKKKIYPKALIAVDYAGYPCDWKKIKKISRKYKLFTINDNCHAMGSEYYNDKKYAIDYSDIVTQSFHPVKGITTGEGGAVITNNYKIYENIKIMRSHNIIKKPNKGDWFYDIKSAGFNYRMNEFQAALGISQLKKINDFLKYRRKIAQHYDNKLKNYSFLNYTKKVNKRVKSSYHLYSVIFDFKKNKVSKKNFFQFMKKKGVVLQVHYMPLFLLSVFKKKIINKNDNFENSIFFYKNSFSLPIYYKLKISEQNYVIKTITSYFKKKLS